MTSAERSAPVMDIADIRYAFLGKLLENILMQWRGRMTITY
jgi:hypothetical protein